MVRRKRKSRRKKRKKRTKTRKRHGGSIDPVEVLSFLKKMDGFVNKITTKKLQTFYNENEFIRELMKKKFPTKDIEKLINELTEVQVKNALKVLTLPNNDIKQMTDEMSGGGFPEDAIVVICILYTWYSLLGALLGH